MSFCPACGPANTLRNHPEMNQKPAPVLSRIITRLSEVEYENNLAAARERGEEIAMADDQACQATPALELERRIMDSRIPKNEHEWWAANEIERLRAKISERECVGCYRRLPVERGMHIGNEYEEIRCTAVSPQPPYCGYSVCIAIGRCRNDHPAPEPSDGLTEEVLSWIVNHADSCGAGIVPIKSGIARALVAAAREHTRTRIADLEQRIADLRLLHQLKSDEVLRNCEEALAHSTSGRAIMHLKAVMSIMGPSVTASTDAKDEKR